MKNETSYAEVRRSILASNRPSKQDDYVLMKLTLVFGMVTTVLSVICG